jgi:hypothetical protein
MTVRSQLAEMPIVVRFAVVGSSAAGLLGALVGLVLGLTAYPPTAWFAIFEVAVPSGILGSAVGAVVGLMALVVQRNHCH